MGIIAKGTMASEELDVDRELAQLLKEQETFMRQQKKPAAKVTRMQPPGVKSAAAAADAKAAEAEPEEDDTAVRILGQVVERHAGIQRPPSMPMRTESKGFPVVTRRAPGQSLFGRRQRSQKQQEGEGQREIAAPMTTLGKQRSAATNRSGDSEMNEIDATNRARLQEMTSQEIRDAQEELLRSLDPELRAKLMNRKKKAPAKAAEKTPVVSVKPEPVKKPTAPPQQPPMDLSKIKTEEELMQQTQRLPAEERAKVEWMQNTSQSKPKEPRKSKKRQPHEEPTLERFDFDGKVLTKEQASAAAHSGLYHHGEDPEAPGYTMPELLYLARSTVPSQRAMALTTIAKILRNRDAQQAPRVLPGNLPLALRMTMDDQNYTALSAAVTALHALLVPTAASADSELGETAFESIYGTIVTSPRVHLHPSNLAESKNKTQSLDVVYVETMDVTEDEESEDYSISDEDLTGIDPIQGLVKMEIHTRIRYIMDMIQLPDQDATEKMLDILIQVARHSPKAAKAIGTNAKLMKCIQQKYVENQDVLLDVAADDESAADLKRQQRLAFKSLVLIRSLCQAERSIAVALVANGVIQSTKGFLALKGSEQSMAMLVRLQVESLRVWRVLLGYGLDFHCFAYLFPLLCGFRGVDLAQTDTNKVEENGSASTTGVDGRTAALFAALEAFCKLESMHEAQHYFNQFHYFVAEAKETIAKRLQESPSELASGPSTLNRMVVATAFRFLTAVCAIATKHHLDVNALRDVLNTIQSVSVIQPVLSGLTTGADSSKQALLRAILCFHEQMFSTGLLADDADEDEARAVFFRATQKHLQDGIAELASTSYAQSIAQTAQACDLLVLVAERVTAASELAGDDLFSIIFKAGLNLVQQLVGGQEHWVHQVFSKVMFHPTILRRIGFFADDMTAASMSHVLVPIYQALLSSTKPQEVQSGRLYGVSGSVSAKISYHLRLPQYEDEYVGSNLPLPSFWMYCPFSRMEYTSASESEKAQPSNAPMSPAQTQEMQLIISSVCRFLYQLETVDNAAFTSRMRSADLHDEDKLFHLMHVFFAGSDVLFNEHVDAALNLLFTKFAKRVISSANPTLLYDGMARNLRSFQQLDPLTASASSDETSEAAKAMGATFTSEQQLVMDFVEKLVAEFTSSSYGNIHFARCVTLLVTTDFPVGIRKWVWKEVDACNLLHVLQPMDQADELNSRATFIRCTRAAVVTDEQWLRLMKQAVCRALITPERGPLAYAIAIYHLQAYLFTKTTGMTFARQLMAQDLVRDASKGVWLDMLDHAPEAFAARVEGIKSHADLTPAQLAAFEALVNSA